MYQQAIFKIIYIIFHNVHSYLRRDNNASNKVWVRHIVTIHLMRDSFSPGWCQKLHKILPITHFSWTITSANAKM